MSLTLEVKNLLRESNIIVIIGFPATGKTTLATMLQDEVLPDHSLISSDDYIDLGYKQSLYGMLRDIERDTNPKKIIEGVQCYRLLRKAAQTGVIKIDTVITVHCDDEERLNRYKARHKKTYPEAFDKNLRTVYTEYLSLMHTSGQRLPRFINITT
jgi:dephospho-CoA kinase